MNIRSVCPLILVLFTLIFTVGCTSTETPQPQIYASQTPVTHPTGTGTPEVSMTLQSSAAALATSLATPVPAVVFSGEYRWAEYRINNTITLPPNPRYQWEYAARIERFDEEYYGIPAVHEKITVTGDDDRWEDGKLVTTKNGFHATENTYFERATKRFLGGTYTGDGAGLDNFSETVPGDETRHEDRHWGWLLISPFEEPDGPLSYEGTESVTVLAGMYPDARRYAGFFHNRTEFPVTFWIADGVPVPVQYRIRNPDLGGEDPVQTFELKGWG